MLFFTSPSANLFGSLLGLLQVLPATCQDSGSNHQVLIGNGKGETWYGYYTDWTPKTYCPLPPQYNQDRGKLTFTNTSLATGTDIVDEHKFDKVLGWAYNGQVWTGETPEIFRASFWHIPRDLNRNPPNPNEWFDLAGVYWLQVRIK